MMLKTLAGNLVPTFIRSTSVSVLDLCFFSMLVVCSMMSIKVFRIVVMFLD